MPKKRTRKPPAEQLGFTFRDFDPRQRALPFRVELEPAELAPLARCTCLDPGDVGERFETIGALMPDAIWEAEHGS